MIKTIVIIVIILINFVLVYISIHERNSSIQQLYLMWVIFNLCSTSTLNTFICFRLCGVGRNTWNICGLLYHKVSEMHMPNKQPKKHRNSPLFLISRLHLCISPPRNFVLMLWTAFFWPGTVTRDLQLWTAYCNIRVL